MKLIYHILRHHYTVQILYLIIPQAVKKQDSLMLMLKPTNTLLTLLTWSVFSSAAVRSVVVKRVFQQEADSVWRIRLKIY